MCTRRVYLCIWLAAIWFEGVGVLCESGSGGDIVDSVIYRGSDGVSGGGVWSVDGRDGVEGSGKVSSVHVSDQDTFGTEEGVLISEVS